MKKLFYEEYKDNFNIYNLITLIDKNYRLVFDKINKCFCIINIANNNEICLKFNKFSLNIIKTLQKTRVENSNKIFKEIDNFNEKLREKNITNSKILVNDSIKELTNYLKRTNSISQKDINAIIEGNYD